MDDVLKEFARAIAAANGHPDPDAYVAQVEAQYKAGVLAATPDGLATPASPAAPAPVDVAPVA